MEDALTRTEMLRRLVAAAEGDPRIVGLVDYGSSSEGRADAWSDVDVSLFVRDADYDAFYAEWKAWAGQFGSLMLGFIGVGGAGHQWTVYDAAPVPLRVDFDFIRASEIPKMCEWSNSPVSVEAMLRYDGTGGELRDAVQSLVGKSLAPPDLHATFDSVCGGLWYYLLRTYGATRRGEEWTARWNCTFTVTGNLCALLRIESGATARWVASDAAAGIERAISPARLAALHGCVPGPGMAGVVRALGAAARLGQASCGAIAAREGRAWPDKLAARVVTLYGEG